MAELAEKEDKRVITVFHLLEYRIKLTKDKDMKDFKRPKLDF